MLASLSLMETNACPGAGEDVEAVLARLQTQAVENANLKDRQAKLEKDQQVILLCILSPWDSSERSTD